MCQKRQLCNDSRVRASFFILFLALVLYGTGFMGACVPVLFADPSDGKHANAGLKSDAVIQLHLKKLPRRLPFKEGEKLSFEFGWNNIPAAFGSATVEKTIYSNRPAYRFSFECRTNAVVDVLWKMRDKGFSIVSLPPFVPHTHFFEEHENKRHKRTSLFYDHRSRTLRCLVQKPDKNKSTLYTIKATNALDPITLAYFLRCFDYEIGKTYSVLMIFSKTVYDFKLSAKRRETIKTPAGKFKAIVFDLFVTRTSAKQEKLAKLRHARIWVSDDKRKLPLRLDSEVFIGRVYGELTKIENLTKKAPDKP